MTPQESAQRLLKRTRKAIWMCRFMMVWTAAFFAYGMWRHSVVTMLLQAFFGVIEILLLLANQHTERLARRIIDMRL